MAFVRHVKVTLWRAKNVNACTSVFSGKSRTLVTAKASYKNLVYTTSRVADMGQNPVWEMDGTNVFHFDFKDDTEYITFELFNRNNSLIGVSKLHFSGLGHVLPGDSETKLTLPVMVTSQRQFGEIILSAEILEQQPMGDRGLLTVEIRRGLIQRITSIFGAKTTKIRAKLTYKHATLESGVLENMGNKFVWDGDNIFTFLINSDVTAEDILKVEIYNLQSKVGECEMRMSLFLEQEDIHLRGFRSEFVPHSTDLCLPNKGPVGNLQVAASFTPKPVDRRSSLPHYPTFQQQPPPRHLGCIPYPDLGFLPPEPRVPVFNPSMPAFDPRSSGELYPPQPPELYPPAVVRTRNMYNVRTTTHLDPDPTYSPSAPPVYNIQEVVTEDVHGAPPAHGFRQPEVTQNPELDAEMKKFIDCFH